MPYGGVLTRSDLVSEVNSNLGSPGSIQDVGDARKIRHLDLASIRLAREADWIDLRRESSIMTTFVGDVNLDAFVDLYAKINALAGAPDLRHIYSIRIVENLSTDHKLIQLMPRQWDIMFPDSRSGFSTASTTSEITHYMLWDKFNAQLYKVPGAAIPLRVRYAVWPVPLTTTSQKSEFENKDELLIALATHTLFQSLGNLEESAQWFAVYNTLLTQAKRDNDRQPDLSRVPQMIREQDNIFPSDYWLDPFIKEIP